MLLWPGRAPYTVQYPCICNLIPFRKKHNNMLARSQLALRRHLHRPPSEREVRQRAVLRVAERQLAKPHPARRSKTLWFKRKDNGLGAYGESKVLGMKLERCRAVLL